MLLPGPAVCSSRPSSSGTFGGIGLALSLIWLKVPAHKPPRWIWRTTQSRLSLSNLGRLTSLCSLMANLFSRCTLSLIRFGFPDRLLRSCVPLLKRFTWLPCLISFELFGRPGPARWLRHSNVSTDRWQRALATIWTRLRPLARPCHMHL